MEKNKTINIDKIELRVKIFYYFSLILITLVVLYYSKEITQSAISPRSNSFSTLLVVLFGFMFPYYFIVQFLKCPYCNKKYFNQVRLLLWKKDFKFLLKKQKHCENCKKEATLISKYM